MADRPTSKTHKHPCPDCKQCQWCSEVRCRVCRPDIYAKLDACPRKLRQLRDQLKKREQRARRH
jgi:hypothetical protein